MTLSVEIPDELAIVIGSTPAEVQKHLVEDAAIGAYCRDAISRSELQSLLGFETGNELDGLLKRRGVEHGFYSGEDLLDDVERLRRVNQNLQR